MIGAYIKNMQYEIIIIEKYSNIGKKKNFRGGRVTVLKQQSVDH
jgi:hypothetical protein